MLQMGRGEPGIVAAYELSGVMAEVLPARPSLPAVRRCDDRDTVER